MLGVLLQIESIKNSIDYIHSIDEMVDWGVYDEDDFYHTRTMRILTIIYSVLASINNIAYYSIVAVLIINPNSLISKFKPASENCNVSNQCIQESQEQKAKREEAKRMKKEKKIAKLQEKLNKYKESE